MAGTDNLLWFESKRIRGVIVTQERYFIGVARHRSGWFFDRNLGSYRIGDNDFAMP
jgi:hypothetical protein